MQHEAGQLAPVLLLSPRRRRWWCNGHLLIVLCYQCALLIGFVLLLLLQIEADALSWSDLDENVQDSLTKVCHVLQLSLKGIAESMNRADELVASMKVDSQALKAAQTRDKRRKDELVRR